MKIKFHPEYYWLAIFAFCFIVYQQVQDNIRPNYHGNQEVIKYLLGIAPNFFPAIGIPSLFVVFIPVMSTQKQINQWWYRNRQITANVLSLFGLLMWEFLQVFTTKGHFDWNDVLWTLIGAFVFQKIWSFTPSVYK